jgi:predicted membrane protein
MKMNFFFGNAFWGLLLLLWGASLILRELGVNLPLVKVFIAIIIIMFGIRLLVGGPWHVRHGVSRSRIVTSGGSEYTTVFASQTIDLTDLKPDSKSLEVTVVFGSAWVELPDDIEFKIEPTSVFGSTIVPRNPQRNFINTKGPIAIDATSVFGRLEFTYKPAHRASAAAADSSYTESEADSLR